MYEEKTKHPKFFVRNSLQLFILFAKVHRRSHDKRRKRLFMLYTTGFRMNLPLE